MSKDKRPKAAKKSQAETNKNTTERLPANLVTSVVRMFWRTRPLKLTSCSASDLTNLSQRRV